eukprot:COSAG04_NODE_2150_length_4685_cov_7.818975_4_plen_318_part_00
MEPQHLFGRRGGAIIKQVLGKGLTKQQFIVKCNTAMVQRRGTLSARKKKKAAKGKPHPHAAWLGRGKGTKNMTDPKRPALGIFRVRGANVALAEAAGLQFAKHTKLHRERLGKAKKGKKRSAETKEKIRRTQTGKKHSAETREKMSKGKKGKKRGNYRVGPNRRNQAGASRKRVASDMPRVLEQLSDSRAVGAGGKTVYMLRYAFETSLPIVGAIGRAFQPAIQKRPEAQSGGFAACTYKASEMRQALHEALKRGECSLRAIVRRARRELDGSVNQAYYDRHWLSDSWVDEELRSYDRLSLEARRGGQKAGKRRRRG